MKKFTNNRKGQFVIIAVMLIAIMIISVGALMHGAVTYYKHEPWEEYSTLIGDIELNSRRILELSLATCTNSNGTNVHVLKENLDQWQKDLTEIYPTSGITLIYSLADGAKSVSGKSLGYSAGIHRVWYQTYSTSSAMSEFTIGINSIGLSGYKLTATTILSLQIVERTEINATKSRALVVVKKENDMPVINLGKENFRVKGTTIDRVSSFYDRSRQTLVYAIEYQGINPPTISVWDQRGIMVVSRIA